MYNSDKIEINHNEFMNLHNQGLGDRKIAKIFNCDQKTIFNYRKELRIRPKNTKRKSIILIHPNGKEERFYSTKEACLKYNLYTSHICGVLKGKRKTTKGYGARYAS